MRLNSHFSLLWIVVLAFLVAGCGGSSSTSNSNNIAPLTNLKKRVLVSNVQAGTIDFVDAQKDLINAKTLGVTSATKMVTSGGTTVALNTALPVLPIIDNPTETVTFNAAMGDQPFDVAISPDGKTAWAAERNLGFIQSVTTATGTVNTAIRIPNARRLVMSPGGSKLLVFPDPQTQTPPNASTFFVVDTASNAVQTITNAANLDQPFTAVFGSSDTQAFILNCGAECGGSSTGASVVSVDFTGGAQNFGTLVPVKGATVGLLNGTNLYVAGSAAAPASCPLTRCGVLTVINTGSFTAGPDIPITDGLHENMAITTTGRLYVGAGSCTVQAGTAANTTRGCLSIFNTSASTVTFPSESSFRQNFSVTSLVPISGRNIIYVIQGGELDIFDSATDALAANITQIDIIGNAVAGVLLDQ